MKKYAGAGALIVMLTLFQLGFHQPLRAQDTEFKVDPSQEVLIRAYRQLANGSLEERQKGISVFRENTDKEVVVDMCVKLLMYYYQNTKFREDDETMYQYDVIAENLIKILGKTRNVKGFPVYLQIVMTPYYHRNDTVKAAWYSMAAINW